MQVLLKFLSVFQDSHNLAILYSVKPGEKKDTKETLLEKIEKEKNGENRPDVIKDLQNKIAKLEEEDDV